MISEIERLKTDEKKFEYSVENPPPLEELESKVYAVHTTPILPKNGILKAGARNIWDEKKWDKEPPSFRPTLHFSLGEVVRPHSVSWDENPYAVVTPLKSLTNQLVNVAPQDTFILGDYKLTNNDTLLVPKGTNVSTLAQEVNIVEYDPEQGLRKSVDKFIEEKEGWQIRMKHGGESTGSVAYIKDKEINSPDFFKNLFEKYPEVSFGTHIDPERGEAFRFGIIEQSINNVMKNYSDHWNKYSNPEIKLNRAFILHNLNKLEKSLEQTESLSSEAMSTFMQKKRRLMGWMNIINEDIYFREKYGKTLTDAPDEVQEQVRKQRNNPEKLRETMIELFYKLKPLPRETTLYSPSLAEKLKGFSPQELKDFIDQNPDAFRSTNLQEFYAFYATRRWITVKTTKAKEEGLDKIIEYSLSQLVSPNEFSKAPYKGHASELFRSLEEFLSVENNRLSVALEILRQPAIERYLTSLFDFSFPDGGVNTLEDVIRANPRTRIIFESWDIEVPPEQQEAYDFVMALRGRRRHDYTLQEALGDFIKAKSMSLGKRWSQESQRDDLRTVLKPIKTRKDESMLVPGEMLSLYEVFKRDFKEAKDIWKKVGLEKEFQGRFRDDQQFWQSSKSMFEIYKLLIADRNLQSNVRDSRNP
jgi:hypothetical protein